MTLVLGILSLLLGPLVYAVGRKNPVARRILDAAIVLAIFAIIALQIIPDAVRHGGWVAIAVIIVGLAFPIVLERLFRKATDTAHLVIVAIAAAGLIAHAVVDGIALLPESGAGLAHAIILHRLPVGMVLWWAIEPNFGKVTAIGIFVLISVATAAGYFVGESIVAVAETHSLAMLQAFVAGSLIHVVIFGVKHDHNHA